MHTACLPLYYMSCVDSKVVVEIVKKIWNGEEIIRYQLMVSCNIEIGSKTTSRLCVINEKLKLHGMPNSLRSDVMNQNIHEFILVSVIITCKPPFRYLLNAKAPSERHSFCMHSRHCVNLVLDCSPVPSKANGFF